MTDVSNSTPSMQDRFNRMDIADVILRERFARDMALWDEAKACFSDDSVVDISWFKGSGREFVEASAKPVSSSGFHEVGHPTVRIRGDRATAITPVVLHVLTELDGEEIHLIVYTRMYSRVKKVREKWLIAGIRSVYVRDMIVPLNPARPPHFDEEELATHRPPYRYLSYMQKRMRGKLPFEQPAVDRPDLVQKLEDGEQAWLEDAD